MSYQGNLSIIIKEAVFKKDHDLITKMDPYLKLKCGKNEYITKTAKNQGKNPKWNEIFKVSIINEDSLFIEAYDDDFGKDKHLGKDEMSLGGAFLNGYANVKNKLYDHHGNETGYVELELNFVRR